MKRLFTLLFALVVTTALWAESFEVDGIYYDIRRYQKSNEVLVTFDGQYSFSHTDEYTGDIVIPETVTYNGITYSVTHIGEFAFKGCSGLTSVIIPNSVTSIGWYAFAGCSSLQSITIPNSVNNIESSVFADCSSLTSVTIPNNVTSIGVGAFSGCSSLTSITIPNSVTNIGSSVFADCSSLTSVTIPNSVTSIGDEAFIGTKLYSNPANWENGMLYVDSCLISAQETLFGTYVIKSGTKLIADAAFDGCLNIISISIPSSVTEIGENAFWGCSGLTSITIPESVTSIGWGAFYKCTGLTSITIPEGVTSIGGVAFESSALYNNPTNWENGVLYINDCLIEAQDGLAGTYAIKENTRLIATNAFHGCDSLTSITIPEGVTSIGHGAFAWCTNLKSIYIPKGTRERFAAMEGLKDKTDLFVEY